MSNLACIQAFQAWRASAAARIEAISTDIPEIAPENHWDLIEDMKGRLGTQAANDAGPDEEARLEAMEEAEDWVTKNLSHQASPQVDVAMALWLLGDHYEQALVRAQKQTSNKPISDVTARDADTAAPHEALQARAEPQAAQTQPLSAEQKIRQAFNQGTVQIGIAKPLVIEHNGVTAQFMARLDRIHRQGQKESVIHIVRIKRGRILRGMDVGWIQEGFKLTGKNELVVNGYPKSISDEDARLFLSNFESAQTEANPSGQDGPTASTGQTQQAQERLR